MAGLEYALRPVTALGAGTRTAIRTGAARPRISLTAWGILIALLAAAVGFLGWQNYRDGQVEQAREAAIAAVEERVESILSYRGTSAADDLAAAQRHLTGAFKDDFATLAKGVIVPAAERDGVSTAAKVVATSVVEASATEVTALVYLNQETTSKARNEPKLDAARLLVTVTEVDGQWLVSDLKPV